MKIDIAQQCALFEAELQAAFAGSFTEAAAEQALSSAARFKRAVVDLTGQDKAEKMEAPARKSCLRKTTSLHLTQVTEATQDVLDQCQALLKRTSIPWKDLTVKDLTVLARKDGRENYHNDARTLERVTNMFLAGHFEEKKSEKRPLQEHGGRLTFHTQATRVTYDQNGSLRANDCATKDQ